MKWLLLLEPKTPKPEDLSTYPQSLLGKALGVVLIAYLYAVYLLFATGVVLCAIGRC